jgi:hypothetical protein
MTGPLSAPLELGQIGQPKATVNKAASYEFLPEVLFPLLCLPRQDSA